MELNFLGNKHHGNEPKEKVVQLKYMGKAYQASMSNASRAVKYSNWLDRMLPP